MDDYVSLEALGNVLKRGARLVDFEIYSYGGQAVVGASPSSSYDFKGTYNCLPVGQVFSTVKAYAFSGQTPNPNDPLFIHLRVKSNNLDVYKQLAKSLGSTFSNLLARAILYSYHKIVYPQCSIHTWKYIINSSPSITNSLLFLQEFFDNLDYSLNVCFVQ